MPPVWSSRSLSTVQVPSFNFIQRLQEVLPDLIYLQITQDRSFSHPYQASTELRSVAQPKPKDYHNAKKTKGLYLRGPYIQAKHSRDHVHVA